MQKRYYTVEHFSLYTEIEFQIGCEQSSVDERDLSHMVKGPTFLPLPYCACLEADTGSRTI